MPHRRSFRFSERVYDRASEVNNKIQAPTNILKAARVALRAEQSDLARIAGITERTLNTLERGRAVAEQTREAVQRALEGRGVEFTNGSAPGFRLPPTR